MPSCRLLLTLAFSTVFASTLAALSTEVHVSPDGSDETGDGSAGSPFRTLSHGLGAAAGATEAVLHLRAGVYSSTSGETFPIQSSPLSSLTVKGPSSGEAVIRGSRENTLLLVTPARGGKPTTLHLEGLTFENGLTAVSVVGGEEAHFDASFVGNRFRGQRYQGLEVVVGEMGDARAVVRGNTLDGRAAFGIDLGARTRGRLDLMVEDNRIQAEEDAGGPPSGSGSEPPRFAMAVFVDAASTVRGSIDRNTILNVPVGILVGEGNVQGDPGLVDLRVSNCLISGDPAPERNRLRHGLYLSLWQHHHSTIRFLANTVVHAWGYGVFQEEPVSFPEREENVSLTIAGCIFWRTALGELSAERPGGLLPSHYREVRENIFPTSGRGGVDGNLARDPLLGASYRPSAGSPALDAWTGPVDPAFPADASGGCRVADGDGDGLYRMDLGALEGAGPCASEAAPFLRGDCDPNRALEITDAVELFDHLFVGAPAPPCLDACDANDDRALNITDGIFTLSFLFLGGPAPSPPYPDLGLDPTPDGLGLCR